jgi:hypothetical protein
MDRLHRKPQNEETRTGRDCRFCQRSDPYFGERDPMDRLVSSELNDSAAAHMTEDGYVKHRIQDICCYRVATNSGPSPCAIPNGDVLLRMGPLRCNWLH